MKRNTEFFREDRDNSLELGVNPHHYEKHNHDKFRIITLNSNSGNIYLTSQKFKQRIPIELFNLTLKNVLITNTVFVLYSGDIDNFSSVDKDEITFDKDEEILVATERSFYIDKWKRRATLSFLQEGKGLINEVIKGELYLMESLPVTKEIVIYRYFDDFNNIIGIKIVIQNNTNRQIMNPASIVKNPVYNPYQIKQPFLVNSTDMTPVSVPQMNSRQQKPSIKVSIMFPERQSPNQ